MGKIILQSLVRNELTQFILTSSKVIFDILTVVVAKIPVF